MARDPKSEAQMIDPTAVSTPVAGRHGELIAMLEAAAEGSRELDADICQRLDGGAVKWLTTRYTGEAYPALRRPNPNFIGGFSNDHVPFVTTSIDAALALIERKLPGWTVAHIAQDDHKLWHVELREGYATSYGRVVIEPNRLRGTTAPLALCSALLRALSEGAA